MNPGRNCPLHYRYVPESLNRPADFIADTLYVIGGLYGNQPALRAIRDLAAAEPAPATLVFNGDFNWFNIDAAGFTTINETVLAHHAIRGNVETELASDDGDASCGCGYPDSVSDADVERSNAIEARLRETAREFPELRARLAALPMTLTANVGGLRIAIVHGDCESLAGWSYDESALRDAAGIAIVTAHCKAAGVNIIASSHTCLPIAMALDTGTVGLTDGYDASEPIRVARFTINDFHPEKRWLSVPEILVYSSNIGSAKMAIDVGAKKQKEYLARFGLLGTPEIELPEVGSPLFPVRWGDISTMTIAYGHGIAVSPLQVATGVSALVNGGIMMPPTLMKRTVATLPRGEKILQASTSESMRSLMRMVVRGGTGKNADVQGYLVGGKTGTAEKQVAGRYDKKALISSFVGAFPMTKPRYVVLAVIDEPKGIKASYGYATGGWVAAPVVKSVIERMGPLFGLVPDGRGDDAEEAPGHPLHVPVSTGPKRTALMGGSVGHATY